MHLRVVTCVTDDENSFRESLDSHQGPPVVRGVRFFFSAHSNSAHCSRFPADDRCIDDDNIPKRRVSFEAIARRDRSSSDLLC